VSEGGESTINCKVVGPEGNLLTIPEVVQHVPGNPEGLIQGDPPVRDDLAALYVARREQLFRRARLMTGSDAIADEVVQDAFVRFHAGGRTPDNPAAYLNVIVANLCRDHLRRRHLERSLPVPTVGVFNNPDVDETWTALCRLPFRQRAVLVLRYYEDLPEAEIAEVLGCRLGTVKSSHHRALAKLRKELSA
jgi:RNA polymerase sigma-70 factor (sigma-E family)